MPVSSEAIILRTQPFGEADLVVTFFTPAGGVQKGFARAARKSRRRFGNALEPFTQVVLHWETGRGGELLPLREAELVRLRDGLRGGLEALALAGYAVELCETLLTAGHDHASEFRLLAGFLDHLAGGGDPATGRLLFELRLLELLGLIPHLLHCSACFGPLGEGPVRFAAARGGSLCPACAPDGGVEVSPGTLGSLSRCLRAPVEAFAGIRLGERTLREGAGLVADALRLYLARPLRSLAFLAQVSGAEPSSTLDTTPRKR